MGTQQILLIVLSVIIVGVAIAVGITMFQNQAYNSNKQAVSSALANYGAQTLQWWKTPISQGGAGQVFTTDADTVTDLTAFLSLPVDDETGKFEVTSAADAKHVVLSGIGKEKKGDNYPFVETTVDLEAGTISADVTGTNTTGTF